MGIELLPPLKLRASSWTVSELELELEDVDWCLLKDIVRFSVSPLGHISSARFPVAQLPVWPFPSPRDREADGVEERRKSAMQTGEGGREGVAESQTESYSVCQLM